MAIRTATGFGDDGDGFKVFCPRESIYIHRRIYIYVFDFIFRTLKYIYFERESNRFVECGIPDDNFTVSQLTRSMNYPYYYPITHRSLYTARVPHYYYSILRIFR